LFKIANIQKISPLYLLFCRIFAAMEKLPAYDCHCHILPGLDDGARTMEESVFLAGKLASYGFERAVCTPHSTRLYRNTPATVIPPASGCKRPLTKPGSGWN
ncbi:MAG: hypothetical protein IKR72_06985, partial [Bacteroidales bacterium]|nr:hypothetical protein [Bacteroidales bacterium]